MSTRRTISSRSIYPILALGVMSFLPACAGTPRMPGHAMHHLESGQSPNSAPSAPVIASDFSASERERIGAVQPIVERESRERGLDPNLIYAVIWVESRFDPQAKSPAGARGLMQLMPATAAHLAKELGEKRPKAYDPEFNIRAGAYYLDRLLKKFDNDETLAVAAYNAGPGNVSKWKAAGDELPSYSQDYVAKVMAARARFGADNQAQPPKAPVIAPQAEPKLAPVDEASGDVWVQRPAQRGEAVTTSEVLAQQSPQLIPEPQMVYDEPVFEPAPELDAAEVPGASHLRVAVRDAPGRWPKNVDDPDTSGGRDGPQSDRGANPTPPVLPNMNDALPELEVSELPDLPRPPALDDAPAASKP